MTVVVDAAMLRAPRLMAPKKAPVSRVVVDRRHPLSRQLAAFVLAPASATADWINLAGFANYKYTASTNRNSWGVNNLGNPEVLATANSRDNYRLNNTASLPWTNGANATAATMMAVFRPLASSVNPCDLISAHAWLGLNLAANALSVSFFMRQAISTRCEGSVPVAIGTNYVLVAKWSAANPNTWVVVLNGEEPTVSYTQQNSPQFIGLGSAVGTIISTGTVSDVAIGAGAIWGRALSLAEMHNVCADPYQFLIPA